MGNPYGQGAWPAATPQAFGDAAAPRKARGTTKIVLIVALSLVVLLAAGLTTWWFVARPSTLSPTNLQAGEPETPTASNWSVPLPGAGGTDFSTGMAFASWLTDTTVIRAQKEGVLAYELKSGEQAWRTPPPGEHVCGATPDLFEGKGAFAYGTEKVCDHLAGIDAATGKITWRIEIPTRKASTQAGLMVPGLMSTNGMIIVETDDTLTAYRLSDGGRQWAKPMPNKCHLDDANAGPGRVVALVNCGSPKKNSVQVIHPRTGDVAGNFPIGELPLQRAVLSAKPIVIQREINGKNVFTHFAAAGKVSEFTTGRVDLLTQNGVVFVEGVLEQRRYAIHGDRLYLTTSSEKTARTGGTKNTALAFDLKTGRRLWESSATQDVMLTYIRADDQGLLTLEAGERHTVAPRLVRLDAATGKAHEVAKLPLEYAGEGRRAKVFERAGTVITLPWSAAYGHKAVSYIITTAS
ncbi:outer membrane protein assembly factor BamB family protein [Nonomuraea glycinis]|uniref:outer membrane protein assembly factor BamB family protein n=1 Tax=Nonomuraea glycinis TaxID=2047744 RepID=UPI002E14D3C7|nr:PQQ-like beta-propeller repeat protein [Nonomuraea glycinis]